MDKDLALLGPNKELAHLSRTTEVQAGEIWALKKENAVPRERLAKYGVAKNSGNSSIPPSRDDDRPVQIRKDGTELWQDQGHYRHDHQKCQNVLEALCLIAKFQPQTAIY